jgi:multiple sugar transport system permease protein
MTRKRFLLAFLTPTLLILFFLAFYPLINAFIISLQDWDIRRAGQPHFIGLENYVEMFGDPRFINSLRVSLMWLVITLSGSMAMAFVLSPLIHNFTHGQFRQLCLFIFTIPVVLPRVGAAYMWRLMYSPSIGIINYFLGLVGIGPIGFLSDPTIALYSVSVIDIWQWGFLIAALMVIMLQEVPRETVEAASLDGATTLQLYRYIFFPIILPVTIPII